MEYALATALFLVLVGLVVVMPLRGGGAVDRREDERRSTIEAARDSKYREIRDAELDYRMGKLAEADYRATEGELRSQAIEILARLDALDAADGTGATDERRKRPVARPHGH
ncbi:MAG: hypothetical protein NVSMB25_17060 [Thermoleophilaceae bacterium]